MTVNVSKVAPSDDALSTKVEALGLAPSANVPCYWTGELDIEDVYKLVESLDDHHCVLHIGCNRLQEKLYNIELHEKKEIK